MSVFEPVLGMNLRGLPETVVILCMLGCGEPTVPVVEPSNIESTQDASHSAAVVESILPEDGRFPRVIEDAVDANLVSQSLVIRVGVEMAADHQLRVTGFGSYDEQTGMPSIGDAPRLNRIVDTTQDQNSDPGVVEVDLWLEPLLWYMASVGAGPTPQPGDYHGALQQLVPDQRYMLHVSHMTLE